MFLTAGAGEFAKRGIFCDIVGGEDAAIHDDIDAVGEGLRGNESTTKIEAGIGFKERKRAHSTSQNNGFGEIFYCDSSSGFSHCAGTVGDDDILVRIVFGGQSDNAAVIGSEIKAIFQHDDFVRNFFYPEFI